MYVSLLTFLGGVVVGIILWSLIKKEKQKRRFNIENQMLRDQKEILELQKKVSDLEIERQQLKKLISQENTFNASAQ